MSDHLALRRSQTTELRRRASALRHAASRIESTSVALLVSLVTLAGEDTWCGPVATDARSVFGRAMRTMSAQIDDLREAANRLDRRADDPFGW